MTAIQRRDCLRVGMAGTAAALLGPVGQAWAADPVPLEWFVRSARYGQLSLSPNGQLLAAVVPVNGRRNLTIIDLAARKSTAVTALAEQDLGGYAWVNNDRLVFWLGVNTQTGLGEQRLGSGLFAINRDGSDPRTLSSPNPQSASGRNFTFRYAQFASVLRGSDGQPTGNDIIVTANDRNLQFPDAYRMDTTTGRKTLISERKPGDAIWMQADRSLAVRAAITIDSKWRTETLHWRPSADADWVALKSWPTYSDQAVFPVGFDDKGQMVVIAKHQATQALFRWDADKRALGELLLAHPQYDINPEDVIFSTATHRLLGVRLEGDRPEAIWFDEHMARLQATVDRALPGAVNLISQPRPGGPVLVASRSDRNPGRWLLLDPEKRQLEELVAAAPWIDAARLSERRFVRYAARDGLSIPAYLTLPPGGGKKLPTVVLVHGGPHLRGETWRFDGMAQFLASRGYAVLQADFRGSKGHGHAHYQAGWKNWGLTMQDDLDDGLAWLVKEGIADPARAAIMGGSYGGYAVMVGLVRNPETWRCGINIVGVTDLELLMDATWSDTAQWDGHEHFFGVHIGDPKADAARIAATSPARHIARVKRPLLMAYGARDVRVPIEHATRIESALKAQGVPLEMTVYNDEAHGFLREANRLDHLKKVEAFLARHMAA